MGEVTKEKINIDDLLQNEKEFNPAEWLSKESANRGIKQTQNVTKMPSFTKRKNFIKICEVVEKEMKDQIENTDSEEWLQRQHEAIIGKPEAIHYFVAAIEKIIRDKNIATPEYPSFYQSLAHAIFHEVWGISLLAKWDTFPNSEAAVISGTELWIDEGGKFVRQPEKFESSDRVNRVRKSLIIRQKDAVLNWQNPELEIEREDGSRITMAQSPRTREDYVMFRRFTVNNFTLEKQAELDTIPFDDIPIYRAIARTMPNMVIAGRVRSAKSTFMKTLIGERREEYVIGCLEKHFELALKKHFPNRLVFEMQAKEGDLHKAIPTLLRMEHDYLVIGEIRSKEMESFMMAAERGERGALSTYHLTDVNYVVPQLARHLLDEYPNRTPDIEIERVAKNIDIIITMEADRDRRKKRVVGVTEIIWDENTRSYSTRDWIRYSHLKKQYYYSSKIESTLLRLLAKEDLEETRILIRYLKKREKESPMRLYQDGEDIRFIFEGLDEEA